MQEQQPVRNRRWVSILLWILAFILMASTAIYQRLTGPTNPLRGRAQVAGESLRYKLLRSGTTGTDAEISIPDPGADVIGVLYYKRYRTADEFTALPLPVEDGRLAAELPTQPMAGKLEYYISLTAGEDTVRVPAQDNVVIRFKGAVPGWILALHVFFMFFGVMFGIRTLFEALFNRPGIRKLAWSTLVLLFTGGLILGPAVQHFAFGAAWTGVPFGWDLTDNKMLLMWLVWLAAVLVAGFRGPLKRRGRWSVFAAAVIMLFIYLIPHSMYGSELDYGKVDQGVPPEQAIGQG